MKIPGIYGLYIGIHNSCQFTNYNLEYRYILSVNIISFWDVRCSIGNIYIPIKNHKDLRDKAILILLIDSKFTRMALYYFW